MPCFVLLVTRLRRGTARGRCTRFSVRGIKFLPPLPQKKKKKTAQRKKKGGLRLAQRINHPPKRSRGSKSPPAPKLEPEPYTSHTHTHLEETPFLRLPFSRKYTYTRPKRSTPYSPLFSATGDRFRLPFSVAVLGQPLNPPPFFWLPSFATS